MTARQERFTWILSIILALYFAIFSMAKIIGVESFHTPFSELGLSAWYGYFIATLELLCAIGVLIKRVSSMSALTMTILLCGALYYSYHYATSAILIPYIFLFICSATVAYWRHDDCITVTYMGNMTE